MAQPRPPIQPRRSVITAVGGIINPVNDQSGKPSFYTFSATFRNYGGTRTDKASGWASVHYFEGTAAPNNMDFTKPLNKVDVLPFIIPANPLENF